MSFLRSLIAAPRPGARNAAPDADIVARIEVRQVEMLDTSAWSAAANVLAALVIALIVRDDVAPEYLALWLVSLSFVVAVLFWRVHRRTHRAMLRDHPSLARARLVEHIAFATLIGLIWSAFFIAAGPVLSSWHMMVVSLTIVGCASSAIPALAVYLPAFYGFGVAALVPLAGVNYAYPVSGTINVALLIVLYTAALAVNARAYNHSIVAALRLRAKNEHLAESVALAEAATSAAMNSKWEGFAHLSHELRTPMNAVIGFSDMMRQQMFGKLGGRYLDYAGYIHESGEHALSLIDSILEVSRAKAGQMSLDETEIDLSELGAECLHMIGAQAAAKRLQLRFHNPAGLPVLFADRRKIRRVVLNLMGNAIKYTSEGGDVVLSLRASEAGLDIVIDDTGIGIAPADIARCQEPFIRLGDPLVSGVEGAGLGLSIARLLVEAHGGHLGIESELGRGTAVTVHFPPARCLPGATQMPDKSFRRIA